VTNSESTTTIVDNLDYVVTPSSAASSASDPASSEVAQSSEVSSAGSNDSSQAATSAVTTATTRNLPDTGEATNDTLAYAGFAILGAMALFGMAPKKKKD